MKILTVGGGGREHAIITALSHSKKVDKLYAAVDERAAYFRRRRMRKRRR